MAYDPVVLIHGAWAGAWVWDRLVPLLEAADLQTAAVDLPGSGVDPTPATRVSLELCVARVGERLSRLDGRVSLVAHSGGGVIASAVAEAMPDRIARIAYVAGMMLPDGMSFASLVDSMRREHPEAVGIGPHLVWSVDGLVSRVPEKAAVKVFFHDCPAQAARAAARRLSPQAERGRALIAQLTAERFGRVPRLYVEAQDDRTVIHAVQRRMCELVPGAKRITMSTGHAPQLSAPRRLADALLPFLREPGDATDCATPFWSDRAATVV